MRIVSRMYDPMGISAAVRLSRTAALLHGHMLTTSFGRSLTMSSRKCLKVNGLVAIIRYGKCEADALLEIAALGDGAALAYSGGR